MTSPDFAKHLCPRGTFPDEGLMSRILGFILEVVELLQVYLQTCNLRSFLEQTCTSRLNLNDSFRRFAYFRGWEYCFLRSLETLRARSVAFALKRTL